MTLKGISIGLHVNIGSCFIFRYICDYMLEHSIIGIVIGRLGGLLEDITIIKHKQAAIP